MPRIIQICLISAVCIVFVGLFLVQTKQRAMNENKETKKIESIQGVKDSTDVFRDLTIPYLRSQSYGGELGELKYYQKKINYKSYLTNFTSQNLRVNGLLTIPEGDTPAGGWPAIVFVHGYIPPSAYRTTQKYVESVDYLARNGFVVFKIDLRGHGSSEGEAEGAYFSSAYVVDVLNAYETLRSQNFINPNKVGLWGHSMAGNIVLRASVVNQHIPAVVIWAGAVFTYEDFLKYKIQDNSYRPSGISKNIQDRRKLLFETYGEFSSQSSFWSQVTPVNYLSNSSTKFSLHHAVNDSVVNVGYSRDLVALFEKNNIQHEYFEYSSGGHNLVGTSFGLGVQRTSDFFKKNL